MMTQSELEAGAAAVKQIAEKHGVASWLNTDQYREIAAAVINAYREAKDQTAANN